LWPCHLSAAADRGDPERCLFRPSVTHFNNPYIRRGRYDLTCGRPDVCWQVESLPATSMCVAGGGKNCNTPAVSRFPEVPYSFRCHAPSAIRCHAPRTAASRLAGWNLGGSGRQRRQNRRDCRNPTYREIPIRIRLESPGAGCLEWRGRPVWCVRRAHSAELARKMLRLGMSCRRNATVCFRRSFRLLLFRSDRSWIFVCSDCFAVLYLDCAV